MQSESTVSARVFLGFLTRRPATEKVAGTKQSTLALSISPETIAGSTRELIRFRLSQAHLRRPGEDRWETRV
jgi:hypothetical protein